MSNGAVMDENGLLDHELIFCEGCGEDCKVVWRKCLASLVTTIAYGRVKEKIDKMTCV